MSKIPVTYNKVKRLIEKFPMLADSDSRLVVNFWREELKEIGRDSALMSGDELLAMIRDCKLTDASTITRNRRLIEEDFPTLRGKNYAERQRHKQDEVKTEIRTIHALQENYQKKDLNLNQKLL